MYLALRSRSLEVTWDKAPCKISSSSDIKDLVFNHKTSLKSKISITYFHSLGKQTLFCLSIARKGFLVSDKYLALSLLALEQPYEPEGHSLGLSLGCGTEIEESGRPKRTVAIP